MRPQKYFCPIMVGLWCRHIFSNPFIFTQRVSCVCNGLLNNKELSGYLNVPTSYLASEPAGRVSWGHRRVVRLGAQRVLWKNHYIPDKYSSKLLSGFLRFYRLIFFSYTIHILSQLATCYSTGCHKSSWYSQRSLKVKCLMKVYLGEPKWVFRELVETLLIVSLLWGLRDECKSVSVLFNSDLDTLIDFEIS